MLCSCIAGTSFDQEDAALAPPLHCHLSVQGREYTNLMSAHLFQNSVRQWEWDLNCIAVQDKMTVQAYFMSKVIFNRALQGKEKNLDMWPLRFRLQYPDSRLVWCNLCIHQLCKEEMAQRPEWAPRASSNCHELWFHRGGEIFPSPLCAARGETDGEVTA